MSIIQTQLVYLVLVVGFFGSLISLLLVGIYAELRRK